MIPVIIFNIFFYVASRSGFVFVSGLVSTVLVTMLIADL